jgi:pyrimidine-nucleoside phosphorylase
MNVVELITKKREGLELTHDEIRFLVDGYTAGRIPDYQMAALCMAVFQQGMTAEETLQLTRTMVGSGAVMDFSDLPAPKVDKHSTGGVGDKTSLVVAPLVAAAGVLVPMISGRGLGFTGGTLDKLESIPGFNVNLTLKQFRSVLEKIGCAMIGQTEEIAPADRKIYALRDVTATVESIPLICASIMSKKLAEGLDALVLDVKTGNGAFMPTLERASDLAQNLVDIGKGLGMRTVALITDMNQPLGLKVGNSLEVQEAIETLKGQGPNDFTHLCEKLAARMLILALGPAAVHDARSRIASLLRSGKALQKFGEMIEAQGGDPRVTDDLSLLPRAKHEAVIRSPANGHAIRVSAKAVGQACMAVGAGRQTVDSRIDSSVGIALHQKIGDAVEKGEPLCTVTYNEERRFQAVQPMLLKAFEVGPSRIEPPPLIKRIIE